MHFVFNFKPKIVQTCLNLRGQFSSSSLAINERALVSLHSNCGCECLQQNMSRSETKEIPHVAAQKGMKTRKPEIVSLNVTSFRGFSRGFVLGFLFPISCAQCRGLSVKNLAGKRQFLGPVLHSASTTAWKASMNAWFRWKSLKMGIWQEIRPGGEILSC